MEKPDRPADPTRSKPPTTAHRKPDRAALNVGGSRLRVLVHTSGRGRDDPVFIIRRNLVDIFDYKRPGWETLRCRYVVVRGRNPRFVRQWS